MVCMSSYFCVGTKNIFLERILNEQDKFLLWPEAVFVGYNNFHTDLIDNPLNQTRWKLHDTDSRFSCRSGCIIKRLINGFPNLAFKMFASVCFSLYPVSLFVVFGGGIERCMVVHNHACVDVFERERGPAYLCFLSAQGSLYREN